MAEETRAEKIVRLQREISVRQMELQYLVLGDPRVCVSSEQFGWASPDAQKKEC